MSIRRNVRLRREYLYRKSLEGKERAVYENKKAVRTALREGKPIPTELRAEEAALRHDIELEDEETKVQKTHIDDEYAVAGVKDPKICVTTSRDPSSRLKMFVKEVRLLFPNSQRINRGNTKIDELVAACRKHDFSDLILVQENRGEPVGLVVVHLPYGPTAYFGMSSVVMRHDIEECAPVSEAFPHLIFHGFDSKLVRRARACSTHSTSTPRTAHSAQRTSVKPTRARAQHRTRPPPRTARPPHSPEPPFSAIP